MSFLQNQQALETSLIGWCSLVNDYLIELHCLFALSTCHFIAIDITAVRRDDVYSSSSVEHGEQES